MASQSLGISQDSFSRHSLSLTNPASTKSSASSIISNDFQLEDSGNTIEALPFFCIICSVGFEDDVSLEKHVEIVHNIADEGEFPDVCSNERSESLGASEVLDTSHSHTSPESNHMDCDEGVQLEDDDEIPVEEQAMKITEQIMASHANNRSYICEYCECAFTHHLRLLHHVRDYHDEGENVFSCKKCCRHFDKRTDLIHHMRCIHKVQKTNYYYQQYAMKNKLKEIHRQLVRQRNAKLALAKTLSEKEAALKISENGAPMTPESRAKWVKALQEADASLDTIDGGPDSDRPYACEVCGSRFKLKAVLMRHIRCVHSETRPYTCDYCGSSFKIRNRLTTHIKMVHPQHLNDYVRHWRTTGNAVKPVQVILNQST